MSRWWTQRSHSPAGGPAMRAVSRRGNTSLCIVTFDGDLLAAARIPAPVPPLRDRLAALRLGGDGDDRAHPLSGRANRERDRAPRLERDPAAGAGHPRGGGAAARAHVRSPPDRREGLGQRRVRPARALLRAPAAARARVLRRPADRPAHVARDGRPAVDPLLPRLRAHLPDSERVDAAARGRGDVRDQARPRRAGAAPGADRRPDGDALQPALAARRAGDRSSGWPS